MQRLTRAAAGTLIGRFYDEDGDAVAPAGALTVAVTDSAGVAVAVGAPDGSTIDEFGPRLTATIAAAQTATLCQLTAVWSDAGVARATTLHEVVGGFLFSLTEARRLEKTLENTTTYPVELMRIGRQRVEEELERITDRVFTPRYRRLVLDGTGDGQLQLPVADVTIVRSVNVYDTADTTGTPVTFTSAQLAGIAIINPAKGYTTLRCTDRSSLFSYGSRNVVIEVEHGYRGDTDDLRGAAILRLREKMNRPTGLIPDRATSITSTELGTIRLDTADTFSTGNPDVDAVYSYYSLRSGDDGERRPASATLDFDPSYWSLFHGGRR